MVSELVGMQAAQFQQVAMLPQGEFQRFLQASSQDRHDVLQRLFHTDRFARIEEWVQEHSKQRREAAESGRTHGPAARRRARRAGRGRPARAPGAGVAGRSRRGRRGRDLGRRCGRHGRRRGARPHTRRTPRPSAPPQRPRGALDDGRRPAHGLAPPGRGRAPSRRPRRRRRAAAAQVETTLDAHRRATACLPVLALLDRARARPRSGRGSTRPAPRRLAADPRGDSAPAPTRTPGGPPSRLARARVDPGRGARPRCSTTPRAARAALASARRSLEVAVAGTRRRLPPSQAELPARLAAARAALDGARAERRARRGALPPAHLHPAARPCRR